MGYILESYRIEEASQRDLWDKFTAIMSSGDIACMPVFSKDHFLQIQVKHLIMMSLWNWLIKLTTGVQKV